MIHEHLVAVNDPIASKFEVEDSNIYNLNQDYNKTTLVGNVTSLGNYTGGGTGSTFDIFDQATERIIQGGETLWQGLKLTGFVFAVTLNALSAIGVTIPYLLPALAPIFGLAVALFMIFMITGRQPS